MAENAFPHEPFWLLRQLYTDGTVRTSTIDLVSLLHNDNVFVLQETIFSETSANQLSVCDIFKEQKKIWYKLR
jgi:hypothetical protein